MEQKEQKELDALLSANEDALKRLDGQKNRLSSFVTRFCGHNSQENSVDPSISKNGAVAPNAIVALKDSVRTINELNDEIGKMLNRLEEVI